MKRLASLIAALVLLLPALASAQAGTGTGTSFPETPALLATFDPPDAEGQGTWVQGQILLRVQIPSRYPFEALDLDLPQIENARVITLLKPRTRRQRSYAGDGYVLETVLGIFPTRSGDLTIPPIRATGRSRSPDGRDFPFQREIRPKVIPIRRIPADWDEAWWMVASRIDIEETWSKPVDQIRAGEIVTRSITLTAFGATSEQMPDIEHGRTRGLQATPLEQSAKTQLTATGVIGTIEKSWTLKISHDPTVYISPVGVAYWDPVSGERRKASVPGKRIEPLPEDGQAIARRAMDDAMARYQADRAMLLVLIAAVAVPIALAIALILWRAFPTCPDRTLLRRCRAAASAKDVYRAVCQWAQESSLDLQRDASRFPEEYRALEAHLFGLRKDSGDLERLPSALLRLSRADRLGALGRAAHAVLQDIIGRRTVFTTPSGHDASRESPQP